MFLSINDREMYITTGRGTKTLLYAGWLRGIIDEMRPYLKDGDYDRAVLLGAHQVSHRLIEGITWTETTLAVIALLIIIVAFGFVGLRVCGAPLFRLVRRFYDWRGRKYDESKAKLAKLRETVKKQKIPCTICPICIDDLKQDDDGKSKTQANPTETLSCGHQFHQSCLETWLRTKNNCPICRQDRPRESTDTSDLKKSSHFVPTIQPLSDQVLDFAELNLHSQHSRLVSQRLFTERMEDWCTVRNSDSSSESSGGDWGGGSSDGGGGAGGG